MKIYSFGAENAPVILLLPGTCCHWKGNFEKIIPLLSDSYRVLCVSYDGFDETEHTEFPTMLEETERIETYIQEHCGGHIRSRTWRFGRRTSRTVFRGNDKSTRMTKAAYIWGGTYR